MITQLLRTRVIGRMQGMLPNTCLPIDTSHPDIDDIIEVMEDYIHAELHAQTGLPLVGYSFNDDYTAISCVSLDFPPRKIYF